MKILVLIALIITYLLPEEFVTVEQTLTYSYIIMWMCYVAFFIFYYEFKRSRGNRRWQNTKSEGMPELRTPLELDYLLKGKIKSSMIGMSLIECIRKKALLLRYSQKMHDYIFIYNKNMDEELTDAERSLLDWMLRKIGDGEKFSLSQIKRDAYTNSSYFLSCYNDWHTIASFEGTRTNFIETKKNIMDNVIGGVALSIGILLLGISAKLPSYLILLSFTTTIAFIIYISAFYVRSDKGKEEYAKWISFFMNIKNNKINIIEEPKMIQRLIIYTMQYNKIICKKILKNLDYEKIKNDDFIVYAKYGILNKLIRKTNKLVPGATAMSFVFVNNKGSRANVRYRRNEEA